MSPDCVGWFTTGECETDEKWAGIERVDRETMKRLQDEKVEEGPCSTGLFADGRKKVVKSPTNFIINPTVNRRMPWDLEDNGL